MSFLWLKFQNMHSLFKERLVMPSLDFLLRLRQEPLGKEISLRLGQARIEIDSLKCNV